MQTMCLRKIRRVRGKGYEIVPDLPNLGATKPTQRQLSTVAPYVPPRLIYEAVRPTNWHSFCWVPRPPGGDTVEAKQTTQAQMSRVLVFHVDDGKFCLHTDWVEAIYPRKEVSLYKLRAADGSSTQFLIHRGQPAWVVDLRQAFGLDGVLGAAERPAFAVVRSGSALLALRVDEFTGVRELDLLARSTVPAALVRDGGHPVGHLVELDGQLHMLLDPNRILSNALRDALDPLLEEALAFRDCQAKLDRLVPELRRHCTAAGLKTYARLSRRNGLARKSAAARTVLKALEAVHGFNGGLQGSLGTEQLLKDLLELAQARQSGILDIRTPERPASVYYRDGAMIDAIYGEDRGKEALKEILALREGSYSFRPADTSGHICRIPDSPAWVLAEIIAQLTEERRVKHLRAGH